MSLPTPIKPFIIMLHMLIVIMPISVGTATASESLAPFHVFGSGGEAGASGYRMRHSAGQSLIGSGAYYKAGFWYTVNALSSIDTDYDGLPDSWEIEHFGNLNWGANDDPDGDLLTNLQEFQIGTNPNSYNMDNDDDGLFDWWELAKFGDLSQGSADDFDSDGYSNYVEYITESDPTNSSISPNPGIFYEYDALGRIKKIIRIR